MKYGFAVVTMKGEGEPWWDEYYEIPVIKKVRIFTKEKDRDNAANIEQRNLWDKRHYSARICKFITKG